MKRTSYLIWKMVWTGFIGLLVTTGSAQGQSVLVLTDSLARVPAMDRQALADAFMDDIDAFPLIEEDSLVTFFFRGDPLFMLLAGDFTGWADGAVNMTRLDDTDLWYRTYVFNPEARLHYKFIINGTEWTRDPLNPRVTTDVWQNSILPMPQYRWPVEMEARPEVPEGAVEIQVVSDFLQESRVLYVYLPPSYENSDANYPVVIVQDGSGYLNSAKMNRILDNMIYDDRIEPLVAVMIPPVQRGDEYVGSEQGAYIEFILQEILPLIESEYRVRTEPEERAVLGASNGGNIALRMAIEHPDVFRNVMAQSSVVQSDLFSAYELYPEKDIKVYLDVGTYDIAGFEARVASFAGHLDELGYTYLHEVKPEGHDWAFWAKQLPTALEFLFPAENPGTGVAIETASEIQPDRVALLPAYPNPFMQSTAIHVALNHPEHLELKVYDITGREVTSLAAGPYEAGMHAFAWQPQQMSSGVYIIRLQAGKTTQSRMLFYRP